MEDRSYLLHKITGVLALIGALAKIISVLVGHGHSTYTPPPIAISLPEPKSEQDKIDEEKRREFFKSLAETRSQYGFDPSAPDGIKHH